MGARVAKPIESLLKIKSIDPNYVFVGADKKAYEEFIEKQKQETLLAELQEDKRQLRPQLRRRGAQKSQRHNDRRHTQRGLYMPLGR